MIKSLAHVCVGARNLQETERFYCSGLGLKKAFDFIRKGEVVGFYLRASKTNYVEVFRQGEIDAQAKSPLWHICFEVRDIDEARRHLMSAGYEVGEKKLGADQSWQAWLTDPNGVKIELHEYTEKSSQITGMNCVLE